MKKYNVTYDLVVNMYVGEDIYEENLPMTVTIEAEDMNDAKMKAFRLFKEHSYLGTRNEVVTEAQ